MRIAIRAAAVIAALLFLGLVMGILAGLFNDTIPPGEAEAPSQSIDGRVATVESAEETIIEQAAGTVRARRETVVSARITGTIASINVRAGDTVSQGDVLVELDAEELQAQARQQREAVSAASARLKDALPNFERLQKLHERGAVSQSELDSARSRLDTARADLSRAAAALEEARTRLSYATMRSPLTGRVVDRLADPGDTATPGLPLVKLYDPNSLRLEAHVPESLGTTQAKGELLQAEIDAIQEVLAVQVDEIVPSAEPGSRTFLVKSSLPPHDNLYPGMFGRLLVPTGKEIRLYVPEAAIARVGQLEYVHVPGERGPERRFVRTGIRTDDGRVEILSGLREGEKVIVAKGLGPW